ncbi:MAG: hypothetical protein OEM05_11975 [Myxococcales bacterium]|nr:hypothetical protein [Myxococcales bacterium]
MSGRLAGLVVLVLAAASGCGELRDLWTLRGALAERYESSGVHLSVEGGVRTLTVSIGRPDLISLSPEAQVALAYEAARFTHATYARASRVDVYELVLEHEKPTRRLIPIHWTLSYRFDPAELQ